MRVAMSSLELQGSSLTATAISSYREQKVLGIGYGQATGTEGSSSTSVTTKASAVATSTNYLNESFVNGRGGRVDSFIRSAPEVTESDTEAPQETAVSNQVNAVGSEIAALPSRDELRLQIIEALMNRLMNRSVKFSSTKLTANMAYTAEGTAIQSVNTAGLRRYQRIQSNFTQVMRQESSISFSAQGLVQTADGRTINLNLNFNVSQCVSETTTLSTEVQRSLCDPLVINFSGPMPEFTGDTMSFDIDCDGKPNEIGRLSSGSGYLALDKNGNGKIDDGSELFGPKTNNGYEELAAYDEDGNGWIDENDSIFDKLKIWCTDECGNEELVALRDKDVGAIYLGRVNTNMDIYSNSGSNTARVRESGLVLLESGESRVMQEMDLRI